ncbi:TonB-dependent receptor [Peristeroidobacter soli]|uniref:TonB-dependent receptor n=1 Tax=Peristeroidobacter soli TaxID=2497877 RepID=UPI001588F237|nr:TonB-dependent receptor [Peristeroidobacter soli]
MKQNYSLLLSLSLGMALATARAEHVPAPRDELTFQIERAPLAEALDQFSVQTGLQVFWQGAEPAMVEPLRGRYSVAAALTTLLKGTGNEYLYINERAILVRRAVNSRGTPVAQGSSARASRSSASGPAPLEEVIVSGVSGSTLGFTGQTLTLTREDFEKQAESSLAGFFRYLPVQPYNMDGRRASGAQYVELRGLGPGTTMILIDGLPVAASSGDGASGFDLSSIPVAAVKLMEITADPPPAHLPGAVGGVVNIVLDRDREQTRVAFKYSAASGGAGERYFSVAGSAGRRIKGTFALEYQQRDFLLGEKRDLWRDQDYRRFGGVDYRAPTSSPGNIHSTSGERLPGLRSSRAAIPAGDGVGLTPADFAATDGRVNLESLSRYYSVVPATERGSAFGAVELPLGDAVLASADFLYTGREVIQQRNPPILSGILVPASNPYNPFGMPLVADLMIAGMPPQRTITDSNLLRSVLSVRSVDMSWNWQLSLINTRDEVAVTSFTSIPQDRVAAAVATADPALSLNIFNPDSPGSRELLEWLVDVPTLARSSSSSTLVRATLAGKVGKVRTLFGLDGEHIRSSFAEIAQQTLQRRTSAGFVELSVPLHDTLSLNAGGRLEYLGDLGEMTGFQYGLRWQPIGSLTVVAAYGKSDRAPTLLEMMRPRMRSEATVVDTSRRGEIRNISVVVGGNPDLDPMRVESWSVAMTWKPESGAYEASAKYWNIALRDQVIVPSLPRLLDHQEYFSERVVRDAPTSVDIAAGQPGPLRLLDFSRLNSGRLATRGMDLLVSKHVDAGAFGEISGKLMATWVDEYVTADVQDIKGTDRVGIASPYGTIPRWRVVGSLAWQRGIVGASTTFRYTPSYADAFMEPTGRTIPSQSIVDVELTLELARTTDSPWLRDLTVAFGVVNVFDKTPAFASVGLSAGFDLSQGDLLQRVGYLRVAKAF